jgi:hypothetical protein
VRTGEPNGTFEGGPPPLPGTRDAADVTKSERHVLGKARPEHYFARRGGSIGEKAMRSILALSLLIILCSAANAATVHHAHRRHAATGPEQGVIAPDPRSGFAYTPPGSPIHDRSAPYNGYNEPYDGASQGYAPGEREQFLNSVRQGG